MFFYLLSILLILIDQISKYYTLKVLKPIGTLEIIKGVFSLTYVENRGAAFGILQNARWIFIAATAIAIVCLIVYKCKYKPKGIIINTALLFILSGAVGNMIDRIWRGFVVDMLEVTFITYPVFNFADCLVVIGAILLAIYSIFIYKESEDVNNDGNV